MLWKDLKTPVLLFSIVESHILVLSPSDVYFLKYQHSYPMAYIWQGANVLIRKKLFSKILHFIHGAQNKFEHIRRMLNKVINNCTVTHEGISINSVHQAVRI